MRTQASRTWRLAALVGVWLSLIALGCTDRGSPVGPSGFEKRGATALPSVPDLTASLSTPGRPTPADLVAHGWSCFTPPPFPTRTECSHPNQGFPPIPPPADRPATYTLWRFENGQFVGTLLVIRPDLYCGADVADPAGTCTRHAPLCESTGEPYSFVPVIRYYTCLHTPGR